MANDTEKIDEKASSSHGTEQEVVSTTLSKAGNPEHGHLDSDTKDVSALSGAKFMEVMNAEYALALSTGPQLKATSWRSIQLFAILLVAFMGSLSNGFDGSGESMRRIQGSAADAVDVVMSAVNGMK